MNIVLTGGGTAGHIMPNLALTNELSNLFTSIYYIGNKSGMEYKLCKNHKELTFLHCESVKFNRQHLLKNLAILYKLPKCIAQARKLLKDNGANIVFSKGGYVGVPVAIAARLLKIPVVCHESDMSLGLANRVTSLFAHAVITSYKETAKGKKYVHIGTPLRDNIFHAHPEKIIKKYNIPTHKPILLVVGGSLGSQIINENIYKSLEQLCNIYFVIHICGKNHDIITHKNYVQLEFVNDIENYLAAATIVISRCGATLAAEITALNKKVLYIPLENSASRGDQIENANYLKQKKLANVLYQRELNPNTLIESINSTLAMQKENYIYDSQIPKKISILLAKISKR